MENIEIRVFLSSTFNDSMVRTRDAFRNEMLARLNGLAGQIQGNVYLNDFELGIPEGTDPLTVVCTCMDAVMASDYFVGIMGKERGTLLSDYLAGTDWEETRYASLISHAIGYGFTVLELEFLCAVTCGIRAFFYLGDGHRLSSDDKSIEKYLLTHNQSITGFSSIEALKQDMAQRLEAEWNLRYHYFSEYSQQDKDVNIIMANKLRYYVPNTGCSQMISSYVSSDSTQALFLTGQGGSGKSTALFDWFYSNRQDPSFNILFFAAEHISYSLDGLLEKILYDIEDIEKEELCSGYRNMATDLERMEYFQASLKGLRQPYVILIDGLEHVSSHMGIKSIACLPESLPSNVRLITTWDSDISEDIEGILYPIGRFDTESFMETFFEKEGKGLIYQQYRKQLAALVLEEWKPDAVRLMLSYIIISAKYNNIETILSEFKRECSIYGSPYCSYLILLNRYFTFDGNEPLKEALLLLYHSKNGVTITALQSAVSSGDRLKEIFYVIYFLLQKNTYDRYMLGNEYVREALGVLYPDELEDYGCRFSDLNRKELLSKESRMEETYDLWEEHLGHLIQNGDAAGLEQIFTAHTGQIASLWYYDRELLLKAFGVIKSPALIDKLKGLAVEDKESDAPFFVSHLFYEYGYYKEACDICENLLSGSRRAELSDKDLAAIFNNLGINLCNCGEMEAGERNLLQAYQIRKRLFPENRTAFFESCDNLSIFYLENNEPQKAASYLDEAIRICDACFGSKSPRKMKCYIRRAEAERLSNPSNALIYYNQALKTSNIIFDPDSLQSAEILQMKGVLYYEMGKCGMALECGMEAATVFEKRGVYNDSLFQIYNLAGSAALVLERQGEREVNADRDSKSWFKKALKLSGELYPDMYEENLEQLISDLPDVEEGYWVDG